MIQTLIQGALDTATQNGGGQVIIPPRSTPYVLTKQMSIPWNPQWSTCLNIGANTELIISEGATLKMADNQMIGSTEPVSIISGSGSNITIHGGGYIIGNTAGQTGWTAGYLQSFGGLIEMSGADNLSIDNIYIHDGFSNPFNIRDSNNINVNDFVSVDMGEGPQFIRCQYVVANNIKHSNPSGVTAGDGFEFSECEHIVATNPVIIGHPTQGAGSAIDLFGCIDCTITGGLLKDWPVGLDINDSNTGFPIQDITIDGLNIVGAWSGSGSVTSQTPDPQNVTFKNMVVTDGVIGFNIGSAVHTVIGNTHLDNCSAYNNLYGLQIQTIANLTVTGGDFSHNTHSGILWNGQHAAASSADNANLSINGARAYGNGQNGLWLSTGGLPIISPPTGSISVFSCRNGSNAVLDEMNTSPPDLVITNTCSE